MPTLRFYFLGTLDVRCDDRVLPKPATLKSRSLLAYLVVHRQRPQPRERLADLFWGNRPERRARSSLSTALWHIRRCLPSERFILSDPHTVQFDPQADLWLDVDAFETGAAADAIDRLESAVALYRGDFLDGFSDDWVLGERYRLETLFFDALARLMNGYEAQGEQDAALATALCMLERDPLREDAHRLAMRAYCRLGRRNVALEQYRRCREVVLAELGVEPMVETTELYQAIVERRFASDVLPARGAAPSSVPVTAPVGRDPLDVTSPGRLVGRERELAFLHDCWQRAEAGQGELTFVSGEAGVGKSRLVGEFAGRLRWQGTRVLWGRCYEFERVLPYQPVADALRSALATLDPSELDGAPAWIVSEVMRLVPEMAERCPGVQVPVSIRSGQDRARLFDGVTRFLAQLSSCGALLVVLEDLHWATESTLHLLHYLARHLVDRSILLVGTLRPEAVGQYHPLYALQQQLRQEGMAESLSLPRLSPEAVRAMLVEMSGAGEAVVPLAERLYRETEGNPFFVIEIVRALFETGVLCLGERAWQGDFSHLSEGMLPLPAGVSDAIEARVRRLGADTQEALHLAVVLGREFDFDLLNAAWGRGGDTLLQALDDLLRHRLIEEGTGPTGRDYAFTHHKIQEVVYQKMGERHRQRAHAHVAVVMESLYGSRAELSLGELAFHFEIGWRYDESLVGKAIGFLLRAGDRARGLYAHEEAIDYYQRALVLLRAERDYEQASRTLMKLGLTYHNAFDFPQARQAYEEGFALWQQGQRSGGRRLDFLPAAPHALRISWYPSPTVLDPTTAQDFSSGAVIDQLFSGLVETSPEMEIVPDIARTWTVSEGGRKYVFHLREDVCWSDGTPVVAEDFEYAWKRVLDPAVGSPNASMLYDVGGARAFHRGEGRREDVGVKALDEATLLVELSEPTGYFPYLLAHHVTYPVPRHVVEAHGRVWAEVGHIVTNGPFRVESWQRGESMMLVRNADYHGRFRGNIDRVALSLFKNSSNRLATYEADGLDVLDMTFFPVEKLDDVRQRYAEQYATGPLLWTSYVGFGTSQPPFDDVRVRRAFALAVDGETLASVILRGCVFPVTGGFIPPGMPGHAANIGLSYDPGRARRLLAEAGYPNGAGFPAVDLVVRWVHKLQGEYLRAQWQEKLNVKVDTVWESGEFGAFSDRFRGERPTMFVMGFLADYPDPDSFLRNSGFRHWACWQNQAYRGLVEDARRVMDQSERMRLYGQADRILMEEVAVIPLFYGQRHLLAKPWVKNYLASVLKLWFWKDVVIEPH
jgi:ABC-type oligopeptide transport system substrate-binding subunit/DNA-binding SARP family transcriptional activator